MRGRPRRSYRLLLEHDPPSRPPALQGADHAPPDAVEASFERGGVGNDVGAVEGGTQYGRVRDLAAMAATDASVVDRGNRIVLQGIGCGFHRQRRAAGQANTGMVAGTGVFIDAKTLAHDALATL